MGKKTLIRRFFWMFIISITSGMAMAQTAEDSVKTTVNNLFKAMKHADTALLRSCFTDSAILQTIARNKEGEISIRTEAVDEFVSIIGKEQKGYADEQIQFDVVRIDGPLAIAWTPYKFYYKGKFSHCGVNSFQLIKTAEGWKIQYLIDTRRRQGCQ